MQNNHNVSNEKEDIAKKRKMIRSRYLYTSLSAVVLLVVIAIGLEVFSQESAYDTIVTICNSFFIVGVVFLGVGGLMFAANEGSFDMIKYGISSVFTMLDPRKMKGHEKFHEYRERMQQKKVEFVHFLIIGAVFLVLSIIFLGISSLIGGDNQNTTLLLYNSLALLTA